MFYAEGPARHASVEKASQYRFECAGVRDQLFLIKYHTKMYVIVSKFYSSFEQ